MHTRTCLFDFSYTVEEMANERTKFLNERFNVQESDFDIFSAHVLLACCIALIRLKEQAAEEVYPC